MSGMVDRARLGGARWNARLKDMLRRYDEMVAAFVDALMADGYPPFTVPNDPVRQYNLLLAWKLAGDPRYWHDLNAQRALAQLEQRVREPEPPTILSLGDYPPGGQPYG